MDRQKMQGEVPPTSHKHSHNPHRAQKKARQSAALGMPIDRARAKLPKVLFFDLLSRLYGGVWCEKCGSEIPSAEALALEHQQNWENDPGRFWDPENIRIRCVQCPDHARNPTMSLVKVTLVDEAGREYPVHKHKGRRYFEGKEGEQYRIKVKNTTNTRLEVLLTVDGLSVLSGEEGDFEQRGYVLPAYSHTEIEGWRMNKQQVAAFRFGEREDSYADLKGIPQHLGLIGVAVWGEVPVPIGYPVVTPFPYYREVYPRPHYPAPIYGSSSGSGLLAGGVSPAVRVMCDTGQKTSASQNFAEGISPASFGSAAPSLGTQYGETVESRVTSTSFLRSTEEPIETLVLEYDTRSSLLRRGIIDTTPTEPIRSPFPKEGSRYIERGYAAPPPRRKDRAVKDKKW